MSLSMALGLSLLSRRNGMGGYTLLPSKVGIRPFGFIVEVPGVVNSDFVPDLGPVCAIASGDNLPSDAHCC